MKKTAIICVVSMLCLALMGFGFARWSDTVTYGATVATGNVAATIAPGSPAVNDLGADPQWGLGVNSEGKNVASITCVQGSDLKNLTVTVLNGYPWYAPAYSFVITSTGTVPVKVDTITSTWSGALAPFINTIGWSIHVVNPESNGLLAVDKTITSSTSNADWAGLTAALYGIQIHQGGTVAVTVDLGITENVGDTAAGGGTGALCPMLSSATDNVSIHCSQWNEIVPQP